MVNLLKTGGVEGDRREEVINALDIEHIPVKEIMIPRKQIVTLTTQKPFYENLKTIRSYMHARYPLVGKTIDDFRGILYTPQITANMEELLNGKRELDDFDWPKLTVPLNLSVSKLIDCFQEQHHELALVQENDRIVGLVTLTIVGLVTLTDAFETIIGHAEDPLGLI